MHIIIFNIFLLTLSAVPTIESKEGVIKDSGSKILKIKKMSVKKVLLKSTNKPVKWEHGKFMCTVYVAQASRYKRSLLLIWLWRTYFICWAKSLSISNCSPALAVRTFCLLVALRVISLSTDKEESWVGEWVRVKRLCSVSERVRGSEGGTELGGIVIIYYFEGQG